MKTPNVPAAIEPAVTSEHAERRYVYTDNYRKPAPSSAPRSNRTVRPRKRSLFSIIAVLLAISILIVFYVWNKISVNRLVVEINDLQRKIDVDTGTITWLNSEISKKTNLERITKIATEQLNFIEPKKPPFPIIIVDERLREIQEE